MKNIWDPDALMNPGVIVDPPSLDEEFVILAPPRTEVVDAVQLSRRQRRLRAGSAALRRRRQMQAVQRRRDVPSYQATHDEMHSTRGRAHLLWEMLQGDLVTDGWQSTEVRDALDLCLSCKGCLSDCPVNVDMATYKSSSPTTTTPAGRGPGRCRTGRWAGCRSCRESRPRHREWSTGWPVRRWRNARRNRAPAGHPRVRRPDVHLVVRRAPDADKPRAPRCAVVLWPDSFTNYLAPQVGRAAVRVLEAAGYGDASGRSGLLRADLDLHRPAAGSQATHQSFVGGAGATAGHGHPRSSDWNRAAPPCCAGTRRNCTTTPVPRRSRHRPSPSPSSSTNGLAAARPRRRPGADAATSTPCSASTPTVR